MGNSDTYPQLRPSSVEQKEKVAQDRNVKRTTLNREFLLIDQR